MAEIKKQPKQYLLGYFMQAKIILEPPVNMEWDERMIETARKMIIKKD